MDAKNDNHNLSRSNRISRLKATSSDLAPQTGVGVATPVLPKRYFRSGHSTICYNSVHEIALFLWALPECLPDYTESMYSLAAVHAAWGDFAGMRETLNYLVDVRIRIAELRDQDHTGEISEANR